MSITSILALSLLLFIPTAWAIIHIAYRDFGSMKRKALWGIFVVFVPPVGGIIYLLTYQLKKLQKKD